ncbi:hypothetical protein COL154_014124 [Colletotrichum chrysophilum]|nr:hypothetical protein COL154_014124 [Colletotrichum chrysophilum]
MTSRTILIVDDDEDLRSTLVEQLSLYEEFTVLQESTAAKGIAAARAGMVDLLIMDVGLPDMDGREAVKLLRKGGYKAPIIMLTAVNETTDRVVGLELGADDYVPKPFDPRELLARVRAVLRRNGAKEKKRPPARQVWRFAGWTMDCSRRRLVAPGDVRIELTAAEFNLLHTFVRSAQRVLTRDQLIELSGGDGGINYDRSIDILVSRLRRKMEDDPKSPTLIQTVRSGGYQFIPEVTSE